MIPCVPLENFPRSSLQLQVSRITRAEETKGVKRIGLFRDQIPALKWTQLHLYDALFQFQKFPVMSLSFA